MTTTAAIPELYEALQKNLAMCHTQLERDCCKAIGGKELRERAKAIRSYRTLTSYEKRLAAEFGYKEGV